MMAFQRSVCRGEPQVSAAGSLSFHWSHPFIYPLFCQPLHWWAADALASLASCPLQLTCCLSDPSVVCGGLLNRSHFLRREISPNSIQSVWTGNVATVTWILALFHTWRHFQSLVRSQRASYSPQSADVHRVRSKSSFTVSVGDFHHCSLPCAASCPTGRFTYILLLLFSHFYPILT